MECQTKSQTPQDTSPYTPLINDWGTPMNNQLKSMDIEPLNYDEPTVDPFSEKSPSGPVQDTLSKRANSITTRAKEAETLFGGISALIDKQNGEAIHAELTVKQVEAFKSFCNDLAKVVAQHFDDYLCDKSAVSFNDFPLPYVSALKNSPNSYTNTAAQALNRQAARVSTNTTTARLKIQHHSTPPASTNVNSSVFPWMINSGNTQHMPYKPAS